MIIVTIMAMMFNMVRIIMIQILLRVLPSIDCRHHRFILDFCVIRIQVFLVFFNLNIIIRPMMLQGLITDYCKKVF